MNDLPQLYAAAERSLAELSDIVEIKAARDQAIGVEAWARQAKDGDLLGRAVKVRKWSTRRLGEAIAEKRAAGELAKGTRGSKIRGARVDERPTLADQGVDKHLADAARKAAKTGEDKFRKAVDKAVLIAVASVEGTTAVISAARAERHHEKRKARDEREQKIATKIIALPKKRYGVILADPEWRFEFWSEKGKTNSSADNHYETSPLEAIKDRDVASIAAPNSALFLWATVPMLPQALEVMSAWGFAYKSHFAWAKDKGGTGYWNRNKHELLLIGTRGSPPAPAPGQQWNSVIEAPVGAHSEKPDAFYKLIEAYFPTLPKIELNARKARQGWDCWGHEAPVASAA